MRRILAVLPPLLLAACSGTATVNAALTHEVGAPAALSAPSDLSGVAAVNVTVLGIDVPVERMRWMRPHTEGNRLGYFRVTQVRPT